MARQIYVDAEGVSHVIGGSGDFEPSAMDLSVSFLSAEDFVMISVPHGVASGLVMNSYSDVAATIGLRIERTDGGGPVTISADPASPSDLRAFAGTIARLVPLGLDPAASIACFGLALGGGEAIQ
jgi:hypothetical protein